MTVGRSGRGGPRRVAVDAEGPVKRTNVSLDDLTKEVAREVAVAAGLKADVSVGLRILARMYLAGLIGSNGKPNE